MTLTEYIIEDYQDQGNVEGFTIGKGKKIYWYFVPNAYTGLYRVWPVEERGLLGWPRSIPGNTEVHVVYKESQK